MAHKCENQDQLDEFVFFVNVFTKYFKTDGGILRLRKLAEI